MNAIAKVPMDDDRLVEVMRDSLYPGAKAESVRMVLAYCQARGLDPLLKPVHIVPMYIDGGMRDVPLPGIALYRIQAARSGIYTGKSEPEFGPDVTRKFVKSDNKAKGPDEATVTFPRWCKVTVMRSGQPFTAVEYWTENNATVSKWSEMPNEMWRKRPYGQLAKCAEAQALRMAFPELTGGDPTAEEMEGKSFGSEPKEVPNLNQPKPASGPTLAEQVAVAAIKLPIIAPSGALHMVPATRWLASLEKALGGLEDTAAVHRWCAEMRPHSVTVGEHDDALMHMAEQLIAGRLTQLAGPPDEEPEPGSTEPEDVVA